MHFRSVKPDARRRPALSMLLVASVALLVTAGCNGPFGLFSGGALSGASAKPASQWSDLDDYGTAQLETRPEDPYSVNIAYTRVDGRLYVNAGDTETNWVENISANPDVRLRIDGKLYDLRAVRVTEQQEIDAFAEAWTNQSMFRRDPTELEGEVWIYRMVPR